MYPFKLIAELRPYAPFSVYACPVERLDSEPAVEHRFAVRWDEDNDERVLTVVQSLYYRTPRQFRFSHAFGERKGMFTVWQLGFSHEMQEALDNTVLSHPGLGGDIWSLETIESELPDHSGIAKLGRAPVDQDLAALHQLYTLGSFVRPGRLWGE